MSGGTGPERPGGATEPAGGVSPVPAPVLWLLVYAAFAGLCLLVYRDALYGAFVSDDIGYIASNPYTSALGAENLAAMLDPRGEAKLYTANYAPVHLLLTALERHMFADAVFGYHLVGVLVHASNATLLVALLSASGAPALAAGLGGLFFAVHPANVEAVAWISQLKTTGALAFAFLALLALRGRPLASVPLFALALLTKFAAAFALPMGAALAFALRGDAVGARRWRSLAAWAVVLALVSIPQLASFAHVGEVVVPEFDDPWVHLRTMAAVGARYLVMAPTAATLRRWTHGSSNSGTTTSPT